jgi:hypothetical protein
MRDASNPANSPVYLKLSPPIMKACQNSKFGILICLLYYFISITLRIEIFPPDSSLKK